MFYYTFIADQKKKLHRTQSKGKIAFLCTIEAQAHQCLIMKWKRKRKMETINWFICSDDGFTASSNFSCLLPLNFSHFILSCLEGSRNLLMKIDRWNRYFLPSPKSTFNVEIKFKVSIYVNTFRSIYFIIAWGCHTKCLHHKFTCTISCWFEK